MVDICSHYDEKYDFLEKEALDTAYGVDGMVRDRKQKYERGFAKKLPKILKRIVYFSFPFQTNYPC